ncbi:MAG: paraquat-inducible protein A [Casimicrobiaceae bacterium]
MQQIPNLRIGDKARCPRCGHVVAAAPSDPLNRPLALALTAAIMFLVANITPMLGLSVLGLKASTTIVGGTYVMWQTGEEITAVIVAFCAVIAPAIYLVFMLTVLLTIRRPPAPHWVGEMLRWAQFTQSWSMNEVMMLGVLVALIKIAEQATVDPGIGLYAVGALVVLFPAIMVTFDPREAWNRIEWADGEAPHSPFILTGAGTAADR